MRFCPQRKDAGQLCIDAVRDSSDDGFSAVKGLGMAAGCVAASGAQPHQRKEGFGGKPAMTTLAREVLEQSAHLLPRDVVAERHEDIGIVEIAVIFRHLIFPNQVIPESAVSDLGSNAMVLMKIGPVMGEDQRWIGGALQPLERLLNLGVLGGKKTVAK